MRPEHFAIFAALLGLACASDVAVRRVPNALIAPFAVGGVAIQWLSGGASAVTSGVFSGAAVFALLFLPWAGGKLGGGDLKLAAATAIWLGPSRLIPFVTFTAMAGIPLAFAAYLMHRIAVSRVTAGAPVGAGDSTSESVPRRTKVPLAIAIALGACAAMGWRLS